MSLPRPTAFALSAFAFLAAPLSVSAAPTSFEGILDFDWYTRDTVHGLDFLDLNLTDEFGDCINCNQLFSTFEDGYVHTDGSTWRLATMEEVLNVWNLAQPLAPDAPEEFFWNYGDPYVEELNDLFGSTYIDQSYEWTFGWTADFFNATNIFAPYISDSFFGTDIYDADWIVGVNETSADLSAWLVREVPEPATLMIFALGLLGIGFVASHPDRRVKARATS
ncbi:MAG: PEP-CTERM sorting domain-containing protein [Magnetospiraceae bacterium]